MVRVDANKERRDALKSIITNNEIALQKELSKAGNDKALEAAADQIASWDPYDQNAKADFFDAEFMFGVKDGFDIVIGNPPYISAPSQIKNEKLAAQREQIIRSNRYRSLFQKWDVYIPFIELGTQLCVTGGITAMIVPFPLTNQLYAKILREVLVQEHNLIELCDLHDTKVFENATVQNCIPFVRVTRGASIATDKGACPLVKEVEDENSVWISRIDENRKISRAFQKPIAELVQDEKSQVWNLSEEKRETNRHADMHVLGDYCYVSYGLRPNSDEKTAKGEFKKEDLISDVEDGIQRRKYIEGKDVGKYFIRRIRYLEYGTERSPSKLVRPTFREWFEIPKIMFSKFGGLTGILND